MLSTVAAVVPETSSPTISRSVRKVTSPGFSMAPKANSGTAKKSNLR